MKALKSTERAPRLRCTRCDKFFQQKQLEVAGTLTCDSCQQKQEIHLFPAFAVKPELSGKQDTRAEANGDHCYHCEDRQAVATCEDCGRKVSAFMKVGIGSTVSCLGCLAVKKEDHEDGRLETRGTAYDNRILALALVPPLSILGLITIMISAPATLVLAVKDWKKRKSTNVVPSRTWKIVLGVVIAMLEIGVAVWGTNALYERGKRALIEAALPDEEELEFSLQETEW